MCVTVILASGDYVLTVFLLNKALGGLHSLKRAYKKTTQPRGLIKGVLSDKWDDSRQHADRGVQVRGTTLI